MKEKQFNLSLFTVFGLAFVFVALGSTFAEARQMKASRKSAKHSVQFRSSDPKGFYRSLTHQLERLPADHINTILARASLAELLFETQNYREAAQIYLQLTEVPLADTYKLSSFQFRLAECYFHMGLYGEAYDQFSRVRDKGHKSLESEAILGMAVAALAQGNTASAQAHLDILLIQRTFYKTYKRALFPLGIMLYQNEQYRRSLDFFENDLEDPANLYFAGIAQRRMGNLAKAMAYFQKLTQKFPGTVWAERGAFEVAESYYQQKDFKLAFMSFQNWLREYPNGTLQNESHYRLACCDIRRENYQGVLDRLTPLVRLDMNPELLERMQHLMIESWVQMGKIDQLVSFVKRKGRSRDRSIDDNFQLMWAGAALGNFNEALGLAEMGLRESYDQELTPKVLLIQGFSHDRINRPAEALAALQTVVDRFPSSEYAARALHLMAITYVKANRWRELVSHVYHHWANLSEDIRFQHPEVEFWITEGQLSLGNYDLAVRRYRQFLAAAPDHYLTPYAYLSLAVALAESNQLDEGFRTLQQFASIAQKKERKDWLSLATLQSANVYFNQKNYEQAIGYYRSFQKENKADPRVPQAMHQEARSLYRLEYYSDAVDMWMNLAKDYPNHALVEDARFQAARTLFDLGKTTDAVKAYQTFIVKHPASPRVKEARLQLAHSYYNAANYKRAIPLYQEFLALYPGSEESVSVQDFLQISYVQAGVSEAELENLTKGQAKSQVLADLYWERGAKAFNDKKYSDAINYFEKIMIEFPASTLAPQASFYRAESLYLLEKYPDAAAAYKNFLSQYPNNEQGPTSMFHLGIALFNMNLFEESAITFEGLITRFPNDPLASNAAENIPLAYSRLGRTAESERAYKNLLARESDPSRKGKLLLQLGHIKEREGLAKEAVDYFEQVPSNAEDFPEAMYSAGAIYARSGHSELEIRAYEKLAGVNPKDNPYRISGLSRLAELYIAEGKAQRAMAVYQDVAKNTTDQAALANAKSRLDELQKVLSQ